MQGDSQVEEPLDAADATEDDEVIVVRDAQVVRIPRDEANDSMRHLRAHQFKPGESGNPKGNTKPRGLARRVRDVFGDDPSTLANVLYEIALDPRAKNSDRLAATRELWDRAYGRAPSHAPIEGGDPLEMTDLDRAIKVVMDELEARARESALEQNGERTPIEMGPAT